MISSELGRTVAAPTLVEFDGKQVEFGAYTLHDWGVAAKYLRRQKQDDLLRMIAAQRENLPPDLWREEWDKAKADAQAIEITPEEIAGGTDANGNEFIGWIDTPAGVAFAVWQLLEKKQPGAYTLERVEVIVGEMAQKEVEKFERLKMDRDEAAQVDAASKNSESPAIAGQEKTPTPTTTPTAPEATATISVGTVSSGS